jgi:hypothetical protein
MDEKKRSKLTDEFYNLTVRVAEFNTQIQQDQRRLREIHNELENAKSK